MPDALPRPQGQPQAGLQIEERDGAVFVFGAHNAFGLQTQSAIEGDRAFKIVDAESDEGDPRLHVTGL